MADKKISALTAATTPLAGTEVLPIVQSGTTKKVSVADLTAGRDTSVAKLTATDNIVIATAGKGIDFSASSHATNMTSELLSDYEEGTWTATIKGGTTDPTTPVTGVGYYTKIGRQVTAIVSIDGFDCAGASGQVQLSGLPFTSRASAPRTVGQMYFDRASDASIMSFLEVGATLVKAVDYKGNAVTYASTGTSYLAMSLTYIV